MRLPRLELSCFLTRRFLVVVMFRSTLLLIFDKFWIVFIQEDWVWLCLVSAYMILMLSLDVKSSLPLPEVWSMLGDMSESSEPRVYDLRF